MPQKIIIENLLKDWIVQRKLLRAIQRHMQQQQHSSPHYSISVMNDNLWGFFRNDYSKIQRVLTFSIEVKLV